MDLKLGDYVDLIDERLSGEVVSIDNEGVTVVTTDGFTLKVAKNEVVKNEGNINVSYVEVAKMLKDKELPKRKKSTKIASKKGNETVLEIDLHIEKLVKSAGNMSNHDILTKQLDTAEYHLKFAIQKKIQKIVFIHGVGEGVLKTELDYLLSRYDNVKYYDADYNKYGLGATEVYVYQNG